MRTRTLIGLLALVVLTLAGTSARAATQNALVTGRVVRKNSHVPFPKVTVILFNPSRDLTLPPQTTNRLGRYTFVLVIPGYRYMLLAKVSGKVRASREVDVAIHDEKLVLPDIEIEDARTELQPVRRDTVPIEMAQRAPLPALLAALAPPTPPFTGAHADGQAQKSVDALLTAGRPQGNELEPPRREVVVARGRPMAARANRRRPLPSSDLYLDGVPLRLAESRSLVDKSPKVMTLV